MACGADAQGGRAAALNGLFDEWQKIKAGEPLKSVARFGTVDWLFREYKASNYYKEKVSQRSRPDNERLMQLVIGLRTKAVDHVGQRPVKSISPAAADKIYDQICNGPNGERLRQGEKVVALCRSAWRVVQPLHPECFNYPPKHVTNPWDQVTWKRRTKKVKPAATRDQVYKFAWGAIEAGRPEPAAAAVICFEFLQRPENVLAGYLAWPHYRGEDAPQAIKIMHHKTGAIVWHPLEEMTDDGMVQFYGDAEAVLAHLPRRGVAMILKKKPDGTTESYTAMQMSKHVRKLRDALGLPSTFTLDACRHGGMTELEEAELTDGQGRALSGHNTQRAYKGYAKQSIERALPAVRKRLAHALASAVENDPRTSVQNERRNGVQNDRQKERNEIA